MPAAPARRPSAPRRRGPRASTSAPATVLLAAVLVGLPGPDAAVAQEGAGRAPGDTVPPPSDTAGAPADTAERVPQSFPRLADGVDSLSAGRVYRWDREDLLESSALTVAAFLSDRAPGLLPLAANLYFGPHHLVDGLLGPGSVTVVVDGRELPRLESAQVDLSRLALSRVDRLAVFRRAGEVVVSVTTPSHPGGDAYSRITAGTGQPRADLIRGVFTNGAGRHFTVAAAVDHLSIGVPSASGNRLDAWGKLSWMPFGNSSGLEVLWHSDALTRAATIDEDFGRSELLVHGRAGVADGVQVDVWAGRTSRDPGPAGADLPGGGPLEPGPLDVQHAELGITASRGPVTAEGDVRVRDAPGLADLDAEVRAAARITDGLSVHAAGEIASWDAFATSAYSGGVAFRPGGAGGLTIRAEAARGTRGVARPGRAADSVSYDALAGSAGIGLGPYRLSARATRRTVERQLPFGGNFDRALQPGPPAAVVGLEGSLEGPLVPMEPLESRLRFEGFWRRNTSESGPLPLYVPGDLARGEFRFQDTYFGGNLEVRALLRLTYRGPMRSARPGAGDPVLLPEESSVNTSVVIRVDTFRIWWRVDNVRRGVHRDFAELPFPPVRNVVGVSWEFFE